MCLPLTADTQPGRTHRSAPTESLSRRDAADPVPIAVLV